MLKKKKTNKNQTQVPDIELHEIASPLPGRMVSLPEQAITLPARNVPRWQPDLKAPSSAQKQRHFLLLRALHLCQRATWLTLFTFKACFPFKRSLADLVCMDPTCCDGQSCGGAQAHVLEDPQILAVHKTGLRWTCFPFFSLRFSKMKLLLCGSEVIPAKHRCYSS